MGMIEGHTEADLKQGNRQIIVEDLEDADSISASIVTDIAYRQLGFDNNAPRLVRDATVRKLKILAGAVLKEMFEPDQDAETAQRHADALRCYAKLRWPD